ncbi:bifunctional diguanylate cyclase/phosphodiesterase [Pararhizobium antarcticum]|uniref:Diguanylate cyclase n=1 Tax=Pararhizobium antarcticum TaxID=1798805 RepID=A0A657LYL9_9HYPH|nr:EAL domain-containing protein [Pararhizobium antarcticum]OJF90373.1 diguanylate cyclase [Rhizobium sp. 58]OJG00565.1 diguanylate cyclase [Pararhizobium antarcticum]
MFKVLTCLVVEHDLRLVLLAGLICFLSSYGAVTLLQRARLSARRARVAWAAVAGVSSGFGIWSTHFIAMIAYDPGVVMGFEMKLTVLSLAVAILMTAAGLFFSTLYQGRKGDMIGGSLIGFGVVTMHFLGMSAIQMPGDIAWDPALVAVSLVGALAFSITALSASRRQGKRFGHRLMATTLMTLGVVSLHFVAMGAVTVTPGLMPVMDSAVMPQHLMVLLIAALAFLLLFAVLAIAAFANHLNQTSVESERQMALFVRGVTDYAICMLDINGRVANWNAGAERAKGYVAADIVGKHFSCFYSVSDQIENEPSKALAIARSQGKLETWGWRYRKDGTCFWAHVIIDAIQDEMGTLIGFAKITKDITCEKRAADRLAEVSANLDLALQNMSQGICLFSHDERLLLANERFWQIFGLPEDIQQLGMTFRDMLESAYQRLAGEPAVFNAKVAETYQRHVTDVVRTGGGDLTEKLPNGRSVLIKYKTLPEGGWVATYEDITDRLDSEEHISFLARHDSLTGLPNRLQFNAYLEDEIDAATWFNRKVAVVGIDLDKFKEINDLHGHAAGDFVLSTLATRMKSAGLEDEFVARLGGDEFAAVKRFSEMAELNDFLSRLEKCLFDELIYQDFEIKPGASMGVAVFPQDAATAEVLVNNADLAMYRAKAALNQAVCFYEVSMDEAARGRRSLANDLWNAIPKNQLSLHYQVQKSVLTGETIGYEVLLRWNHPERGMVPPSEFIPLAEECGAILPIGEWVLREACREAASWNEGYKIAVNLSPVQLSNSDIVALVHEVLLETGLSAKRLELEITESTIIQDKDRALLTLRQIKALGATIAIDDFGTGYSSLETLRAFPFDKIKLDRSFMLEVEVSPQAKAIVRAILALGQSLAVPVLAEGVETQSQLDILQSEGCDEAQGYFLGRPQSMDAHALLGLKRSA